MLYDQWPVTVLSHGVTAVVSHTFSPQAEKNKHTFIPTQLAEGCFSYCAPWDEGEKPDWHFIAAATSQEVSAGSSDQRRKSRTESYRGNQKDVLSPYSLLQNKHWHKHCDISQENDNDNSSEFGSTIDWHLDQDSSEWDIFHHDCITQDITVTYSQSTLEWFGL